jgi:hypothetical protein
MYHPLIVLLLSDRSYDSGAAQAHGHGSFQLPNISSVLPFLSVDYIPYLDRVRAQSNFLSILGLQSIVGLVKFIQTDR